MGEMFIDNLMQTTIPNTFLKFGIVFLGSTFKRKFASDDTYYGWGEIIKKNNLKVIDEINLPTHWTNDNNTETKYIFTNSNI
jgi:hypothetical protein